VDRRLAPQLGEQRVGRVVDPVGVVTRADRTRTAFYAHFEDRRELLMRLVEPLWAEARAAIEPFVDGDGDVRAAVAGLPAAFRAHEPVARAWSRPPPTTRGAAP
jgi:AcrR family transcriptional regulator